VVTGGWDDVHGTAALFARPSPGMPWSAESPIFPIEVGLPDFVNE
jgi:hypothetical protein